MPAYADDPSYREPLKFNAETGWKQLLRPGNRPPQEMPPDTYGDLRGGGWSMNRRGDFTDRRAVTFGVTENPDWIKWCHEQEQVLLTSIKLNSKKYHIKSKNAVSQIKYIISKDSRIVGFRFLIKSPDKEFDTLIQETCFQFRPIRPSDGVYLPLASYGPIAEIEATIRKVGQKYLIEHDELKISSR